MAKRGMEELVFTGLYKLQLVIIFIFRYMNIQKIDFLAQIVHLTFWFYESYSNIDGIP